MSQFTFCRYVVLTSLCPPPKYLFLQQGWYIHTQLSHLSRQRQWLLKNKLQELLPSVHPSLELPFPILSTYLGINFAGVIQKVSSRALCWRAEHWYWDSFWDRHSNVVYRNLGVGNPFLLVRPPRNSSEISQESVLPTAGPQALEKILQGLCRGRVALAVIVGEMWSGLSPERIQLVVVFSSRFKGKGFVAIHVTQDS